MDELDIFTSVAPQIITKQQVSFFSGEDEKLSFARHQDTSFFINPIKDMESLLRVTPKFVETLKKTMTFLSKGEFSSVHLTQQAVLKFSIDAQISFALGVKSLVEITLQQLKQKQSN